LLVAGVENQNGSGEGVEWKLAGEKDQVQLQKKEGVETSLMDQMAQLREKRGVMTC
jgi:hypothetical protein